MSRLPTPEELARWNPITGLTPDPTLRERVTFTCDRPDRWGKCRVTAILDGQSLHHDVLDPYSAYHRGSFAENVFAKAAGCAPDESTDLRWIGDGVIAAADANTNDSVSEPPLIEPYVRFPVAALPSTVAAFVEAAGTAIGCDPSFIAMPLLACVARAVGNRRVIRLKRSWTEPAILWLAIIGKSGTHKTPALQAATEFLNRKQSETIVAFQESQVRYDQEMALYDRDYQAWKRSKTTEPPPWPPQQPVCERYVTTDCTIEALAALLANQFDGILVPRDELSGWFGGIAEYKGGKGSDLGHWLASWSAAPMTVDRKTGAVKMLHVPRAAVSIVGGIQPGVLRTAIGQEHLQDGLCARLLLAMPDAKPVRWTDAIIDPSTEAAMASVFDRLLAMSSGADGDGNPEPFAMPLTPEAKVVWIEYYNRHRAELGELDDDLAAAWSKLEAYAARFALIFQLCSWAAGEATDDEVDEASIQAGITLADWFGGEARRVYGLFGEAATDREQRELIELVRRKGGRLSTRELMRSSRRYSTSANAESALDELVRKGWGDWEPLPPSSKGGKPTRTFLIAESVDVDDTPRSNGNGEVLSTSAPSAVHRCPGLGVVNSDVSPNGAGRHRDPDGNSAHDDRHNFERERRAE